MVWKCGNGASETFSCFIDLEFSYLNAKNDDHDTFSNDELLNAFNDSYVNFEKLCLKNKTLKKQLDLLSKV